MMGASAEEHESFWIHMTEADLLRLFLNVRVVLDAASHTDSVARNTERGPPVGVLSFWYANQIQKPEGRRDKKSKPPVSSFGARGEPRVHERKRNAARVRFSGEIWPNLRFNQNDPRGTNDRKSATHDRPVIKRRVHDFDPRRRIFIRQGESRCGG